MEVGKIFYPPDRERWRAWLSKNHASAKEIWLVYYKKDSGKPRIPYGEAVEEALCFGWIDSITKRYSEEAFVQRFTPRKAKSPWSEPNKERLRKLIRQGKMTPAGLAKANNVLEPASNKPKLKKDILTIPKDIEAALKADRITWTNFQKFPETYKRIRVRWIEGARKRPEIYKQRLRYFIKMTSQNKKYGMIL